MTMIRIRHQNKLIGYWLGPVSPYENQMVIREGGYIEEKTVYPLLRFRFTIRRYTIVNGVGGATAMDNWLEYTGADADDLFKFCHSPHLFRFNPENVF